MSKETHLALEIQEFGQSHVVKKQVDVTVVILHLSLFIIHDIDQSVNQ